jgi:hypothetical protein
MRMHEREAIVRDAIVRDAENNLREKVMEFAKEYAEKLTHYEYLRVVHGVLSDDIGSQIKYAIRYERHGDTNKPAGAA